MSRRLSQRARRTMSLGIDQLESRQLLSTGTVQVDGLAPAHHHQTLRLSGNNLKFLV